MAVRLIEEKRRSEAGVLAARRPNDRAQAQVGPIDEENVEEVTDLAATGKGQDLVGGEVGRVEAVTELLVRNGREEAEGGIRRPGETKPILAARVTSARKLPSTRSVHSTEHPSARSVFASASAEAATLAARS